VVAMLLPLSRGFYEPTSYILLVLFILVVVVVVAV